MHQKPWLQLAFVLGEAALSLVSGGVLFIVISRVSGSELLGAYALTFAWIMLFQGLSSFGIPEFLMREVGMHGKDSARQVLHALALGLGSGVVAIGLMLAAVRLVGYPANLVEAISIASFALIPAFLNTACRSVFLALRQMHLTFLALLAEVAIVMSASLYLLLSGHGIASLMITLVAGKIVSAAIAVTFLCRHVLKMQPAIDLSFLVQTARTVLTFGIGNMLGMLTMRINMIIASAWVDIGTLGHFAAATKIMEVGLIIPNLFVQLLMTRLSYSFNTEGNKDPNRFSAWYEVLFTLIFPVCVGISVFAGPILQTLFGGGFDNAVWVLRILMAYLAIEAADAIMSVILLAAQKQRKDVTCLAFNPLTNIALSLALLPTLGIVGVALGRVGGVCASALLRHLLIGRELAGIDWLRIVFKPALVSLALGALCYSLMGVYNFPQLLVFYAVLSALILRISSGFSGSAIKEMMRHPSRSE